MKISPLPITLRGLALGLIFAWAAASTTFAAVAPVDLVAKAAIEKLLGRSAPPAHSMEPELDEDTGGSLAICTYQTEVSAVIITLLTFASPQDALTKASTTIASGLMEGENAKVTEEKDLGDRAYWGTGERGATIIVVHGIHVLGIGLGGTLAKPPASYHDMLRKVASDALTKL